MNLTTHNQIHTCKQERLPLISWNTTLSGYYLHWSVQISNDRSTDLVHTERYVAEWTPVSSYSPHQLLVHGPEISEITCTMINYQKRYSGESLFPQVQWGGSMGYTCIVRIITVFESLPELADFLWGHGVHDLWPVLESVRLQQQN